jgi:hypothetical protein
MSATRCKICGETKYDWRHHECPHVWHVRFDDWEPEDTTAVYADTKEDAAEKYYSERFANFDYQTDVTLIVMDDTHEQSWRIGVRVESVPQFTATVEEEL